MSRTPPALACLLAVFTLCASALAQQQTVDQELATIYATQPAKVDLSHEGELSKRAEAILHAQAYSLVPQLHAWSQDPAALLLFGGKSTESDIRSNGHLAFGLAVLARATHDTGAQDKSIAILRFMLPTHGAGGLKCADGKQWHNQWQSAYWAYSAGKAAWFLWDSLDPKMKWLAARMICDEADRFVNQKPPMQIERDTKAEENAWDSMIIALAFNMFPNHPHHETWRETAIRWQINSFVTSADAKSEKMIDGKPLKEWLVGANLYDDYSLENHDRVHPDYMGTTRIILYQELPYEWAGNKPPEALRYNVEKVYAIEKKLALPDGSFVYPNGEDWQIHRNADWIDLNSIMAIRFNDPQAARLARISLENAEKMLARHPEGGIHIQKDELFATASQSVLVEIWSDAYLLYRTAGEGPAPVDEAQLWKDLAGTYVFDFGKFAVIRGEHFVSTFSWGRQLMGMCMPLRKDLLLTPNVRGMIGSFHVEGKKSETPVVKQVEVTRPIEGAIAVCGVANRGLDGATEQRFAFLALPDGRTIYADDLPPTEQVVDRIPIGVLNETEWIYHTPPTRTVYVPGTKHVFPAAVAATSGDVTLESAWFNIDDALGILRFRPVGDAIYHARPSPIRARLEQVFAINSAIAVFYPGQTAAQTSEIAGKCKLEEPIVSSRDYTIDLDDGKHVHIDLENLKVSIP